MALGDIFVFIDAQDMDVATLIDIVILATL